VNVRLTLPSSALPAVPSNPTSLTVTVITALPLALATGVNPMLPLALGLV